MAASKIAGLFVSLDLNFAKFTEGWEKVNKQTARQTDAMTKAFRGVSSTLAGLGIGLGFAGVVQGMRSMVNASLDFESSFAGVRKTVNGTEAELQKISNSFIQMSKTIPVSTTELNNIGASAGQLGIKTQNIVKFTRVMADLGVTTNLSSTEAAQSLARLANITQLPQENFDRLGSVIVALGNKMATTESEIVAMGLRLAGAGKQIGLTEAQTLAFGAALSSVGIEAEAGGSAISKVFIQIAQAVASGNEDLAKFAKVAGLTSQQFADTFKTDSADAIVRFIEGLNGISKAGGNVFGVLEDIGISEVRMRDALLRSAGAGDLLRRALAIQGEEWKKNNALTTEAGKRYETAASQIDIYRNKVTAVSKQIGDVLVPHLINFLAVTSKTITVVEQLGTSISIAFGALLIQQIVTATAAIKGFGAAVLALDILTTWRSLGGLKLAIDSVKFAVPGLIGALTALQATLSTLAIPALVASLVVLVVELFKTEKAWNDARQSQGQLLLATERVAKYLKDTYNEEVSKAGKSLEQWNKEVVRAVALHEQLSADSQFSEFASKLNEQTKKNAAATAAATAAANNALSEEQKKKLESLIETFRDSLQPVNDLQKEIQSLTKALGSSAGILDVYGDKIIAAVEAQRAHGIAVSDGMIALANQARQLQFEKTARERLIETMQAQIEMRFKMAAAPVIEANAIAGLNALSVAYEDVAAAMADVSALNPENFVIKFPELESVERIDKIFSDLGLKSKFELQGIADATKKAYQESGLAAEQGTQRELSARIGMLSAQREAIIAAGQEFTKLQQKELDTAQAQLEKFSKQDKLRDGFQQIGQAISSGIEEAMRKWEGFGKLAIGILDDIAATILRNAVTAPLTKWLGDALNFGLSALTSGVSSVAAPSSTAFTAGVGSLSHVRLPGFASGGTPEIGKPSWVGERGPEIFVPKTTGTIIPNDAIGGGQTTVIQYNIDARGASAGIGQEIKRALRDVEDRAVMRSLRTVQELKLRTA